MATITPSTHSFSSQRLTLRYVQWGGEWGGEWDAEQVRGSKPLLVLVHGGFDQKRSWDWVANALSEEYHVIAPDLRGHGQSDWTSDGDYGVMDHVYDLASLIDHLGAEDLTLMGHSLGGNITLRYTGLFPQRIKKLVAIEGLGRSPKALAEFFAKPINERLHRWMDDRRSKSDRTPRIMQNIDEAISRMQKAHHHLRADQIDHLTRTGITPNDDGTIRWAYDPAALGISPSDISKDDFATLIGRITCPTWLVYGEKSWASNPQKDGRIKMFNNQPSLTEYADAGHWLHHDRFDDFMKDLRKFLST